MFLISITTENKEYTVNFIKKYEKLCIELSSKLRKSSNDIFILSIDEQIVCENQIIGVLQIGKSLHFCIPCLLENLDKNKTEEIKVALITKIDFSKIKCITGERKMSQLFLDLMAAHEKIPNQVNNYSMMGIFDENKNLLAQAPEKLANDDEIICLNGRNPNEIYQLHKEYLIEEVIPRGKQVNDNFFQFSINDIFKTQLVYAISSNDEYVAKANTNAIGFNNIQIGGVYTSPLYRRNYYAWHLVFRLCQKIIKNHKNPCLFVNEKNLSAKNLYKKMGFSEYGKLIIAYY